LEESLNGIILWGTGHPELAEKLDLSRLNDHPTPWPEEYHYREPWRTVALVFEGSASNCLISAKRLRKPVIIVAGACSSAMPLAWHFADMECLPEWGSVICIRQRQGKGQLGRDWISPPGNLYAAVRLPEASPEYSGMMSLVIGYAVIRVLQEIGLPARLKWPNDIMIDGKKAGGILIHNRKGMSVAGIGLNLLSAPEAAMMRSPHAIPATHLSAAGHWTTPLSLWEDLVDQGTVFTREVLDTDIATGISRIQAHMAFLHQTVRVDDHSGGVYHATPTGLGADGGLVLEIGNETKSIRSGSISPLQDF
jgi:BirA family biotin operon repressor/biotin-[acetyl-CoA-carboxylase] ligase